MNTVTIHNTKLPIVEYQGQRVVTLAMIDEVHERAEGTAGRNYREHRERLVKGSEYFELTADEIRRQSLSHVFPPRTAKGILLTEGGYLMLVKSLTDDLAWDVQRQLVNSYFRAATLGTPDMTTDIGKLLMIKELTEQQLAILAENKQLQVENQQQAEQIESMESLFMVGETTVGFARRLNGVRCDRINSELLKLGWLFNEQRDPEKPPMWRVASMARDKYLTERPFRGTREGGEPFVRYTPVMLLDGTKRLHKLYLAGRLPMKQSWDGEFTHFKLEIEGHSVRVVDVFNRPGGRLTSRSGEQGDHKPH
ncbi:ORF6N domain-containing protein [uncultured Pseudomonas sp.]|uniref:ORF6N domain-containing protein n=1 Tax=uncultured Pseudomonas sp. TaxID=114707 RepID=UPI0025E50F23|nr:ORF6N domain-containing protein [uncultured Pseudomonas sp.]